MDHDAFVERYGDAKSSPWAGSLGVYIVSPKCPTGFANNGAYREECGNNVPKNVKIGKATGKGGFRSRFKSYFTYWPGGLLVHGLLTTPSFDKRWFTYKDYATKRETTLKRVLKEKKLIGFGGPANGTERLGSEWVRATPAGVMPYLNSVASPQDQLYGCTREGCTLVPRRAGARTTRGDTALRALVEKKRPSESASGRVGGRGKPRVKTRQTALAARPARRGEDEDPTKPRAEALVAALDSELSEAKAKLAEGRTAGTACPLRERVIRRYAATRTRAEYTHHDVSGDGSCYFYAVLRALGLPLTAGGRLPDAIGALGYFDSPRTKRKWARKLQTATWADPIDVLVDSLKMRRALFSRGVRYVVKLDVRAPAAVTAYMRDPLAAVRSRATNSVHVLTPAKLLYDRQLSHAGASASNSAFASAHADGRVVTFVWRDRSHYEVIVPTRLSVVEGAVPRALAEVANTSGRARAQAASSFAPTRRAARRLSPRTDRHAREALSDRALNDSLSGASRPARRTRAARKRQAAVARKKALYAEPRRGSSSLRPPTSAQDRAMRRHQPLHRYHADRMTNAGLRHRDEKYNDDNYVVNERRVPRRPP